MGCGLSSEVASAVAGAGNPEEALEQALRRGDTSALETALSAPVNVNKTIKDEDGNDCTALHIAARMGHARAVQMLLKANANPKVVDGQGKSPLHWAAMYDHPEVISELIKGGAEADLACNQGTTALMIAIIKDNTDSIHALIQVS
ncbi:hypothetical protein SK128_015865 [Halocaridina rubra]|uniref:Ankyrin repeat protein n=1 Tax=Halocaridina rubra TaxID=373956 RepID=A0AAN8WTW1_HALRR